MRRRIPERSVSVCVKDSELGSNSAGALRFVLRPHAVFSGILEIVDCEDNGVAYRKISRDGRSWCETFHKVPVHAYSGVRNITAPPSFGSVDSRRTTVQPTLSQASSSTQTSTSTLLTLCGSQDHRCYRQQQQQLGQRHPHAFEQNRLWEMSSPCPISFPLHCRDARGVIDPIPMTALVADRLQFCYRFHLAGNKMKWMARPASTTNSVELQCFVRTTLIALLRFSNNLVLDRRGQLQAPGKSKHAQAANAREHLPVVTIFPLAFSKLAPIDADVVESFVIFTGVEVLECISLQSVS
ncbi:hypothetical protein GGI21_001699 [Coemansia aciculifera]|uniref:Uncharacterized protein n=1 Tax=Coemansia aciculifera TaxID=417176 RepID=A0ACC1LTZ6_9FUNG|nr:hypothetical protein IWW38_006075 [Coemansia aciculifera]KAJ2909622.1 hypothetical protein GGI21_001699 [Coemansia aciculifera]